MGVLICKPYRPSEAERKDPQLFKENVRELMRTRLVELHDQEERKRAEREARPSIAKGLDKAGSLFTSVSKNVSQGADQIFGDVHQGIMSAWRDLGPKQRGNNGTGPLPRPKKNVPKSGYLARPGPSREEGGSPK